MDRTNYAIAECMDVAAMKQFNEKIEVFLWSVLFAVIIYNASTWLKVPSFMWIVEAIMIYGFFYLLSAIFLFRRLRKGLYGTREDDIEYVCCSIIADISNKDKDMELDN